MNVCTIKHREKEVRRQVKVLNGMPYVTIDNKHYEVHKIGSVKINAFVSVETPIYKTGKSFVIVEVPVFKED